MLSPTIFLNKKGGRVRKILPVFLLLTTPYCTKVFSASDSTKNSQKSEKNSPKQSTLMLGHRGASFDAPENTHASIKKAFDLGADGVEIDVQLTHDKKIIVLHDDILKRTATYTKNLQNTGISKQTFEYLVNTPVHLLEYNQLNKIDIGLWKKSPSGTVWKKELVPTLNQVLPIILNPKTPTKKSLRKIQIEIKTDNLAIISTLKNTLSQYPKTQISQSIFLISFDLEVIKTAKREIPYCTCLLVREHKQIPTRQDIETIISTIIKSGLDGIALEADPALVTQELVNKIHQKNKIIGVWVYPHQDTLKNLHYFKKTRVNFFTTNLPSAIANTIKQAPE